MADCVQSPLSDYRPNPQSSIFKSNYSFFRKVMKPMDVELSFSREYYEPRIRYCFMRAQVRYLVFCRIFNPCLNYISTAYCKASQFFSAIKEEKSGAICVEDYETFKKPW